MNKLKYVFMLLGMMISFNFSTPTSLAASTYDIVYYEVAANIGATPKAQWISKAIIYAGSTYRVDPLLITAVMEAESSFRTDAVSKAGAIGLMQLLPDTARSYGVNPYDPFKNIMGGTAYLRDLLNNFKDYGAYNVTYALAGYNAGGTEVRNHGVRYNETREYVNKINFIYRKLIRYR